MAVKVKIDGNEPAFSDIRHVGITKREYFAIHADVNGITTQGRAENAVDYADRLIEELNKDKKGDKK